MSERRPVWPILGSLLFLVLVPGTVAGWIPFWLTGWRVQGPLPLPGLDVAGGFLVVVGLVSLLDSFLRFAIVGLGTPAPIAPPKHLVISGQYQHVRNPMYVAVVAVLLGQGMVFGSILLLRYAGVVWLFFHAWVLLYEEPTLRAEFGARYEEYRRNVGRWWPRARPWSG